MYPVLIGSRALVHWQPNRKVKPSTDWDVISFGEHKGCEVHDPTFLNNQDMTGYASSESITLPDGKQAKIMSMLGLSIIKRSHLWRDLRFQKHITDYHKHSLHQVLTQALKDASGKKVQIVKSDLMNRTAMTEKEFLQGSPNLMQSTADFFDDAVQKKYKHDDLHELFAYYDKPLYTRLQDKPGLAWCSAELWYNLSREDQIKCIVEEVYVIAAERFLIPLDWKYPMKLAYTQALDKVCTTLCSGYFRAGGIDMYPEVQGLFHKDKFLEVKSKLV